MKKILVTLLAFTSVTAGAATLELVTDPGQSTLDLAAFNATPGVNGIEEFNADPAAGLGFLTDNPGEEEITIFNKADAEAGLGLYVNGPKRLKITYLGSEAGDTNLALSGGTIFNNKLSAIGDSVFVDAASGFLPLEFAFETLKGYTAAGTFTNAVGATSASLLMGAFVEASGSVLLFFGDGLGDTDFDDMIVRISAVPVPAAVWLFGSVLAGVFGIRYRKRG